MVFWSSLRLGSNEKYYIASLFATVIGISHQVFSLKIFKNMRLFKKYVTLTGVKLVGYRAIKD